MRIFFDMDGTINEFYEVEGWLDDLLNEDTRPYKVAKPRINFSLLARVIHRLQNKGYSFGIISWLSKSGTEDYNARVTEVKLDWLRTHLPSVNFDEIFILPYGTPKSSVGTGVLFDDEEQNRIDWEKHSGIAFDVDNILDILRSL